MLHTVFLFPLDSIVIVTALIILPIFIAYALDKLRKEFENSSNRIVEKLDAIYRTLKRRKNPSPNPGRNTSEKEEEKKAELTGAGVLAGMIIGAVLGLPLGLIAVIAGGVLG